MLRLLLALATVAAVPLTCGDAIDAPGQANYRAELTVLNRTEREVQLFTQGGSIEVPACGERTLENFLINTWQVTSSGRDMIRSSGGRAEPHSYLVVTNVVRQVDARPDPLPPCSGLLQGQ